MNNPEFEISVITNKGLRRKHNEDNFFINESFLLPSQATMGAVMHQTKTSSVAAGISDGMGGENSGEKAALTVVSNIFKCIIKNKNSDDIAKLKESIKEVNGKVCKKLPGSGATLAMIYANGKKITAASIGDSRIYLYSKGKLRQLTTDHTLAQLQLSSGMINKEQAEKSGLRHVLMQYIGIPANEMVIEPDVFEIEGVESGDVLLICSDGMVDSLGEREVKKTLECCKNTELAAALLMNRALSGAGKDNITVMLIKIKEQ